MDQSEMTRRRLLSGTARLAVAGGVVGLAAACSDTDAEQATATTDAACVDPGSLAPAETSLRQSVNYAHIAPNTEEACVRCAFFHAEGASGCGRCDILRGVVSETGHCSSWAPRA